MKNIKELTEQEAIELLSFVHPKYDKGDFMSIKHEPTITEDGRQQITFSGRSIIGIEYHNGQDRCILHFDNTKAVLWLYKHGFDITEMLEQNAYMSEMENDFSNAMFEVMWLAKGEEGFKPEVRHKWTLDYVKKKCTEIYDKYFMKDYE